MTLNPFENFEKVGKVGAFSTYLMQEYEEKKKQEQEKEKERQYKSYLNY